VRQKPTDMLGLSKISGVGATKMDRYGEAFLAVIRAS
jgi:superfamily II DNA helicase RecQ